MTREEINIILEKHKHWLHRDCEGWENMRANLRYADLSGADLYGAYLSGADLRYADLRYADLSGANLRYADLRYADLSGANLRYANLSGANLSGADLYGAYLYGANLSGANLSGAKNVPFIPIVAPSCGEFIGFKKASNHIVKLRIPSDAKRLSATTRKCRCDKAEVLEIQCLEEKDICELTEVASDRDKNFIYRVGEMVEVKDFDDNRWNECSTGIHFFINREEAVNY